MKLPLEESFFQLKALFPEYELNKNSYCEFGRLAILNPHRSKDLLKNIVKALCKKSVERGYRYLFSMSPEQQARCYRMIIQAINFPHPYIIHNNIELPQKMQSECGILKMKLSSLRFPNTLENDSSLHQSKVATPGKYYGNFMETKHANRKSF